MFCSFWTILADSVAAFWPTMARLGVESAQSYRPVASRVFSFGLRAKPTGREAMEDDELMLPGAPKV